MAREDRRLHVEEQDHHVLADPPLVAPLPLTDGAHRRLSPGQGVALILVAVVLAASAALAPGITLAALGWTG
ncbi:hypothetical protein DMC25_08465, partial [Caulobacter sp. D4A]